MTAVTIAVCTFRRPAALTRLLPLLIEQAQQLRTAYDVDVLVVDNDPDAGARSIVAALPEGLVRYVHEPRPGISAARNAVLEHATGQLVALLDDDETPHPGWLRHLLQTWETRRPVAVSGRVVSAFDGDLDPWLEAGGFFIRRNPPTGTPITLAATNNLLLDRAQLDRLGLRFDDRFGRSGGEDTMLTSQIAARGGLMLWCAEAVVTDHVPRDRMTRDWVTQRARNHGSVTSRVALAHAETGPARLGARARLLAKGAAVATVGAARSSYGRLTDRADQDARGTRATWRGRGMIEGALGREHQPYASDLTVLQSFPTPRPTSNPYVRLVTESIELDPHTQVQTFSWRTALLGRYDVFHAHWPETLIVGASPSKTAVRQVLFALLLLRSQVRRVPLVRTKHNLDLPSGLSVTQRALLRWAERQTDLVIRLNPQTPVPGPVQTVTIPHGDYRDWYSPQPRATQVPGRLTFVGQVRGYKGVERLLTAFQDLDDASLTLHIAGRPTTTRIADDLARLVGDDPRITLVLEHLSDARFVQEVSQSELVVLPYPHMHNSGTALAALSLDRPVLVPDVPVNQALQQECGPGWVHLFTGELSAQDLRSALAAARQPRSAQPDLTDREWPDLGRQHVRAYRLALGR